MKKTYTGTLGCFYRDHKYDLSVDIVKKLPRKFYQKTCAPWDEQKDHKAIAKAELQTEAINAKARAEALAVKAEELGQLANEFVHPAKVAQDQATQASEAAKAATEKAQAKKATQEQKQRACELVRASEKASALQDKAHGELIIAMADARLARLEAEDVEREAKQLCEQAGIKFEKPEEPESEDGTADTEGQTVTAGQER